MTSLLTTHLDQIHLCATSIASLPFPPPKIFTNALLSPNHDITSLIRDTEQHERALFHLAPPPLPKVGSNTDFAAPSAVASAGGRRQTGYAAARHQQPRNKAVAAVLGGDLFQATRGPKEGKGGKAGDIDVEVLLKGAEKLAGVYPIPGATDRITSLRRRHQQLAANIAHYETRVAEQTRELQAMNRPTSRTGYRDSAAADVGEEDVTMTVRMTREDLAQEEEEIRELERKKRGLEERVVGMERDLGGLMR